MGTQEFLNNPNTTFSQNAAYQAPQPGLSGIKPAMSQTGGSPTTPVMRGAAMGRSVTQMPNKLPTPTKSSGY